MTEVVIGLEANKIEVIEVEKPRINRANIARSGAMMTGAVIFGIGLLFCITIIGLIPGLFGVLIGLVIMAMNVPKAIVKCPTAPPQASVECERCKTNLPILWTKK